MGLFMKTKENQKMELKPWRSDSIFALNLSAEDWLTVQYAYDALNLLSSEVGFYFTMAICEMEGEG